MSNLWIHHANTLWPAIVAALTVSLAWRALGRIGRSLSRIARSGTVTVCLRVTVRAPKMEGGGEG
jgi:hypothetical protein